jgi:hypothetical protein
MMCVMIIRMLVRSKERRAVAIKSHSVLKIKCESYQENSEYENNGCKNTIDYNEEL